MFNVKYMMYIHAFQIFFIVIVFISTRIKLSFYKARLIYLVNLPYKTLFVSKKRAMILLLILKYYLRDA